MDFEGIKKYWEDRAAGDSSAQSTTQDYYLREIEHRALSERIGKHAPMLVADIGCGDGRTTARLAASFPNASFSGFDYARPMIKNAKLAHPSGRHPNLQFHQHDIREGLEGKFDLVYSTRCLINLPSWELQMIAIDNIHGALAAGGVYLMVENFIEGHDNFNRIRRDFALPEIPIREHNFFFNRQRLLDYADARFELEEEINISSVYYLVSRIIYSKICFEAGKQPDYFDDHHRFAAGLPYAGEFGPVRLLSLIKK